jgi:hypothetical protein
MRIVEYFLRANLYDSKRTKEKPEASVAPDVYGETI